MSSNLTLAARLDEKGKGGTCPPGWLLDKLAEEKMTGGYGKRNVLCGTCFTRRSVTGACGCER